MQYRPELDGLRTVAIIPVLLFHAGLPAVPGGYVGVDVFFVISGYLITSLLLQDLAEGRFRFRDFYARRIRRIAPTLMLVLFVSIPFAWLWMLPEELKVFGKMLASTTLFLSNVTLWGETGYFEASSELSPLLHTWSLAVEEQFYLVFPLLLLLFHRLWCRGLNWLLLFGILASFAFADWASTRQPAAAYYLIPTRAWQLLLGAWLALHFSRVVGLISRWRLQDVLAGAGLLMIAFAIFSFDEKTPFPGRYALLPTLGAALVLAASSGDSRIGCLLASRPFVHVGLLSYAMYVWHQPVLAFARLRLMDEITPEVMVLLCLLVYVLAWLTWRFVEQPVKNWTISNMQGGALPLKRLYTSFALSSALALGAGVVLYNKADAWHRQVLSQPLLLSLEPVEPHSQCFDGVITQDNKQPFCRIGAEKATEDFVLYGDSHALSLHESFGEVASRLQLAGLFTGLSGCPPLFAVHVLHKDQANTHCHDQNERVFSYVKERGIRRVLLAARWTYYTDGGYLGDDWSYLGVNLSDERSRDLSRRAFEVGVAETERRYREIGVELLWIMQVPQQKDTPRRIYGSAAISRRLDDNYMRSVSIPLNEHLKLQSFVQQVFEVAVPAPRRFSFDGWLCDMQHCLMGTRNASRYSDDDHLSREGARDLLVPIRDLLTTSIAR